MPVKLLMGNEALGLGAIHAGVNFVSGYPGTPSTEVLETVAKHNDGSIHVEWATNEKAALEAGIRRRPRSRHHEASWPQRRERSAHDALVHRRGRRARHRRR